MKHVYILSFFAIVFSSSIGAAAVCTSQNMIPAIKQKAVCMYGQHIGSCGILSDRFHGNQVIRDSIDAVSEYYQGTELNVIEDALLGEFQALAIEEIEEEIIDTAIYKTLRNYGLKYTGPIGRSVLQFSTIGRVVLRRLNAWSAVLSVFVVPNGNSGCSEIRDMYINRSSGSCDEDYNFDGNVMRFITMSQHERAEVMNRYPGVCGYYENFHETLVEDSFVSRENISLQCRRDGFELVTKTTDGWLWNTERKYDVSYESPRTKVIQTVSFDDTKYEFDRHGRLKSFSEIREDLGEMNLFKETKLDVFSAYTCCRQVARGRTKCLDSY